MLYSSMVAILAVRYDQTEFLNVALLPVINPFMPNGISHCYQLDQSITILRVVEW